MDSSTGNWFATLNVGATGKIDGSVKADTLSIDMGAEVMGSIVLRHKYLSA